jgi:uncharacterized membrane protein YGL010W
MGERNEPIKSKDIAMKTVGEQMSIYEAYHKSPWNKLTHFFGIPLIVFSILIPLSWLHVTLGGVPISAAMVFVGVVLAYYVALDVGLAATMLLFMVPLLYLAHRSAALPMATGLAVFLGAFVGGWIIQLIGHQVFEKRRPAFTDNLIQLLIGPLYFIAEVLFVLGFKHDLAREIRRREILARSQRTTPSHT